MKKRDVVLVVILSCGAIAVLFALAAYLYMRRRRRKREDDEDGTSCAIRVDQSSDGGGKGLNRLNGFLNLKTPLISTKTLGASRSEYVESAVGYVELKRDTTECLVRAKVVPEHKISKKYYLVTVTLNEKENSVLDATCNSCPASAGGCKHALVVLFWLQRKTTKPSPTSVQCYWVKPRLASEGTQPLLAKNIAPSKGREIELGPRDPQKLQQFLQECKKRKMNNSLILSFLPDDGNNLSNYSIFDLILDFTSKNNDHSYNNFKSQMCPILTKNVVDEIEDKTKKQAESKLWHNIRQGRITASKVYELCHCDTPDGSLVEQVLGGYKVYDTKAMKRGKLLEKPVAREIERKIGCKSKIPASS